jgi:uncharacterized membrane protein YhaH (DUF805 family)
MDWMILPYRRYFEFSGRSRRKEYWWFALFTTVVLTCLMISVVAAVFSTVNAVTANPDTLLRAFGPGLWTVVGVIGLFILVSIIPGIAVQVRRLHDLGASGWWYLAFIVGGGILSEVPNIGESLNSLASLGWIVWMFFPGTKGPNKYGDDPKDPFNADIFA